jgi:hypothetical protein
MRLAIFIILAAALAGCSQSDQGVITKVSGPEIGKQVPALQFVTTQGKKRDFDKVRYPYAILVFTSPPGETCCWLDPRVIAVADEFYNLPVSVVQLSEPTSKCPHGEGFNETCHLRKAGLMSLCDSSRIAWNAFGQPSSGTVLLIDRDNKIIDRATLNDMTSLVMKAQDLGRALKRERPLDDRIDIY